MGKKKDLSAAEKRQIVQYLGQGITTLDISKRIARDHRTVKKFVTDSQHKRVRSDKGKIRKISAKQMRRVNPCMIFGSVGPVFIFYPNKNNMIHYFFKLRLIGFGSFSAKNIYQTKFSLTAHRNPPYTFILHTGCSGPLDPGK